MHVCKLKCYSLRLQTPDGRDLTSPLAEVRDSRPVGHLVFSTIAGKLILDEINVKKIRLRKTAVILARAF